MAIVTVAEVNIELKSESWMEINWVNGGGKDLPARGNSMRKDSAEETMSWLRKYESGAGVEWVRGGYELGLERQTTG